MENVRIGFSRSHGFISRAIMLFTRSNLSHTFFQATIDGREVIIGADANGFVLQSYERFIRSATVDSIFSSQDLGFDLDQGKKFLLDRLDDGYDYEGLLGMIPVEVARWFHKKVRNPFGSISKLFCSEAGAEMLQAINFPGAKELDPHSTDPAMLRDFLREHLAIQRAVQVPHVADSRRDVGGPRLFVQ